ncbi:polysaccharide deacetylase family protein [Paenibacillus roseipurpureus]|uniref:Polysaccharide deacetylase family protein n=1 Tax=Paenibacillus roseopurpureus TaxID=2918901 RepID=A0AA96LT45_9BACL|nr:polysaccharide deacetylase family protein [Paenibacillus sp. MBLB1832]WNR46786.1 polysaccharide deacetylase family protein [Paenibacillus sp. MBLB1832]
MPVYMLLMVLLMGSLSPAQQQERAVNDVCTVQSATAAKQPPIDTSVIHYTNKALFLTYHHLDEQESYITITPAKFKQHLQVLKDKHYNVIPIEDYVCFHNHRKTLPPNAVVITFDDGYRSFYEKAYPLLKKTGYPATNFLIINDVNSDYPSLPFLSWEQILEMKRDGFSFYSHSYDLHQKKRDEAGNLVPPLTNRLYLANQSRAETEEERKARVREDLLVGEAYLKAKLHNQLSLFCFPMGEYNQTTLNEARVLGFSLFFTTKEGINTGSSDEIMRISVGMPYVSAELFARKLQQYDLK